AVAAIVREPRRLAGEDVGVRVHAVVGERGDEPADRVAGALGLVAAVPVAIGVAVPHEAADRVDALVLVQVAVVVDAVVADLGGAGVHAGAAVVAVAGQRGAGAGLRRARRLLAVPVAVVVAV